MSRTMGLGRGCGFALLVFFAFTVVPRVKAQDQDDEIVATLAGGRVIVHGTHEDLTFAVINEPIENGNITPRVVSLVATTLAYCSDRPNGVFLPSPIPSVWTSS